MQIIKKVLKQRAVLWRNNGTDHSGARTFDAPEEIRVRWDDQIGEFTGTRGETITTKASVMSEVDIAPGDHLKLGELSSDVVADPLEDPDAYPVQAFQKIPTLNGRKFVRISHL